jgi:hypothetical protein
MSAFRTLVVSTVVTAAIVAACTSPSSPNDAHRRMAYRVVPLTGCTGGNVSITPCNQSFSEAKNATDSITVTYGNTASSNQGYDVSCSVDGTVVLSCTPEDTQITVPKIGNVHLKYHFNTRATAGTGHLNMAAEDLNNGNFDGSTITIVTH